MAAIYVVGVFLGFMLGINVGFCMGARYIERLVEREEARKTEALMKALDWQE